MTAKFNGIPLPGSSPSPTSTSAVNTKNSSPALPVGGDSTNPTTSPPPTVCDIEQVDLTLRWSHRSDMAYFDHGAFGGCPIEVMDVQSKIRRAIESNPHDFFERKFPQALLESKQALARFLNCDVRGLVLVPGATHALNIVIHSQKFLPGDEILTTNHAYSSVKMTLDAVAQRDGAQLVVADVPFPTQSDEQIIESILSRVTPRTRFAVVDHIPSRSAIIFPIKQIVSLLAARGIDTLVDGAHAPGMIELDIASINAPYYVANCHKWMCSPRGIGFIHVRHDRFDRVQPLIIARSPHIVSPAKYTVLQHSFDWLGTSDPSAYLSIPATIKFLETVVQGGYSALVQRNHRITIEARKFICCKLGIPIPCPEHMIGSMATMPLPDAIGPQGEGVQPLQRLLWEKYRIVIPVYAWPSYPKRVFRISVQAYNFLEQYAWLAEILRINLPECTDIECVPRSMPPLLSTFNDHNSNEVNNTKRHSDNNDNDQHFETALISIQRCIDPYLHPTTFNNQSWGRTTQTSLSPLPPNSELNDPDFQDLQRLSLLRIVSVTHRNQTASPPPLFPMVKRDHGQSWPRYDIDDIETENSWLTYTLSNYPERGLPAALTSLVERLLSRTSILNGWPAMMEGLQHTCDTVVEELLLQMDARFVTSVVASGGKINVDKRMFSCQIVPYATHDGPSNLAVCLWRRALEEIAQHVEAGRPEGVEQFLQIHSFLKDPIGGLRGSFGRQVNIFRKLLRNFARDNSQKTLSCDMWQAVIAQMAMESSFLAIPKLQKVAHIYVTGHQQLTYVYEALNKLCRSEFSMPRRVLELVEEMVHGYSDGSSCDIEIAPITITYCCRLQRNAKPSKIVIDGNNRVTAIALLRFLAIRGLEILESTDLTRELVHHCRKNSLSEKWFVDMCDALHELCSAEHLLRLLRAQWSTVAWFRNVTHVPVLVAQEQSFHTVWIGQNTQHRRITLLQPIQQTIFADEMLRLAIPAKQQSHGRSIGFKALPLKRRSK